MDEAKPFNIPKRVVWKAFKRVKANRGTAGVDRQSIAEFEADLSNNLYKLWNRMCSGSYFPPPVRRVEIPKADGGIRPLGIPTVADRIAQEVARRYLEPRLEPVFHADSYGYRPGRSAIDAVRTARQRCWRYDWVLDGGRQHRPTHDGDAAGWSHQPVAGEPVPALRVRYVDGADLSAHSVRAIRGRYHLSL
jgi:RNA-directed DNA polymerase